MWKTFREREDYGFKARPKVFVYGLVDPRTDELRYIGLSTQGFHRPRCHAVPSTLQSEANSAKTAWLVELTAAGFQPRIIVLQECLSVDEVRAAERRLISERLAAGDRLTNYVYAAGFLGPYKIQRTEEFKARQRARMLGSKLSPEAIAKRSASRAGWTPSEETREKLSLALKGRPKPEGFGEKSAASRRDQKRTPEQVERIKEGRRKGKQPDTAHIRKLGASWRGKVRSPETKARMAEAKRLWWQKHREAAGAPILAKLRETAEVRTGTTLSAETRAKMSAAKKGKLKSEATRARMTEAKLAYWAKRRADEQAAAKAEEGKVFVEPEVS